MGFGAINGNLESRDSDENTPLVGKKIEDKGTNGTLRTFLVLLKGYIGSGLIGMPFAFLSGGFWPGIITLVLVGIISTFCIHLLFVVKNHLVKTYPEKGISTFGEISHTVFGRVGNYFTIACLIFTQCGFATAYLIFIGTNLNSMFPILKMQEWILVVTPLAMLLSMIRRWKWLAPFGGLSNLIIFITVGVVIWYSSQYVIPFNHYDWEFVNRVDYKTLPLFFGIAVYAFEGIGLVIDIEKSMQKPQYFGRVLWITTFVLIVVFAGLGAVGYFAFQLNTNNIILLNLPQEKIYTKIVIWGMMFALLITYPFQMFPVFAILENAFFNIHTAYLELKRTVLRIGVIIVTVALACSIPHFGLFLSLIGSVGCSSLAFMIPTVLYLKIFWKELNCIKIFGLILILVFGVAASVITASVTIVDIIKVSK